MVTSALIGQLRREYGDKPKTTQATRQGDGQTTLFNTGKFPIIEGSYTVYKGTSAQTDVIHYALDLDNGDLRFAAAPASTLVAKADFQTAYWRDKNWMEAIAQAVESLNARGFFRQIVRNKTLMGLSANVREYSAPSACVDLYEVLTFDTNTTSGLYQKLRNNWSYQQDANKLTLDYAPTSRQPVAISYLRNLQTPSATSMTLDVLTDWIELVKKKAGAIYYRSLAGKIAQQGNATVDEGHFSFTNLRAMANDLDQEFERLAARKKPTRPAKDLQYQIN
jgi:muramidase (phage lysozyme)